MPRSVLRMVASVVACCAALGFVLGLSSAAPRPRLPGEAAAPAAGETGAIAEARPVLPEDLEKPKPEEETPLQTAAVTKPKVEIAPEPLLMLPTDAAPPQDKVGEILDTVSPPAEEPPH